MKNKVLNIIAEQFNMNVADLKEDMSFSDDLNIDSIDLLELIMSLEEEFDIEINDEVLENIKTVGDVINYLED